MLSVTSMWRKENQRCELVFRKKEIVMSPSLGRKTYLKW